MVGERRNGMGKRLKKVNKEMKPYPESEEKHRRRREKREERRKRSHEIWERRETKTEETLFSCSVSIILRTRNRERYQTH